MKVLFIILLLTSFILPAERDVFISLNIDNFKPDMTEKIKEVLIKKEKRRNYKFNLIKVTRGLTDVIYYKYSCNYKNILIDNNQLVVSVKNDNAFLLTGEFAIPQINSLIPVYSFGDTFKEFKKGVFDVKLHSEVKKVFIIRNNLTYLTYKVLVEYNDKSGYHLGNIYFDTKNKKKVFFDSNIQEDINRKVYTIDSNCLASDEDYLTLPGDMLMHENSPFLDDNAVNFAYINTGTTYYFYLQMFNRDSFDNMGIPLVSTVHARFNDGHGCYSANAFFMGNPYNQMVYGDGSSTMTFLSKALDVTAHEITHAVTDRTSNLYYYSESGALNEAISDIFGATAEAWGNSGGNPSYNPNVITFNHDTWLIGEEIFSDHSGFRDMSNPQARNRPDHYSVRYMEEEDYAGVHINSGIISLAYYLLVAGGNHPNSDFNNMYPDVDGIGMSKAIRIFYEAETGLFTKGTGFGVARKLLVQAAKNLYGNNSYEALQVGKAFDIVGVFENGDLCMGRDADCEAVAHNSICIVNIDRPACACKLHYHWNEDQTECIEDSLEYECSGINCDNNGTCTIENGTVFCSCDNGYHNEGNLHCVEDVDICQGINCDNNGTCIDDDGIARCNCSEGYHNEGDLHCAENEADPCSGVNCDNHGSCINNNGNAVCNCDNGYHNDSDLHCVEDLAEPCEGVTCDNHGTCIGNDGNPVCNCNYGYHNDGNLHCVEDSAGVCEGVTCDYHGNCVNDNGDAICSCDLGYERSGNLHCIKKEVDPCQGINCDYHGICVSYNGSARCDCDYGYRNNGNLHCISGTENPCRDIGCNFQGRCEVINGKPVCNCNKGYESKLDIYCVRVNICEGIDCGIYGSCIDNYEDPMCVCGPGYHSEGLTCVKSEIELCKDVSCSYHGTCAVEGNKASCICEDNYRADGLNCVSSPKDTSCSYSDYESNSNSYFLFLILMILFAVRFSLKRIRKFI